jgi:GNAT superfamily N-acetyltransferase
MIAQFWRREYSNNFIPARLACEPCHVMEFKIEVAMPLHLQPAVPDDATECVHVRGLTRENAISRERLAGMGITAQSWAADIESGNLPGFVCRSGTELVGYCFGDRKTGEVVVLALLPAYENQGLGHSLLALVVDELRSSGHRRLFLGCSSNPSHRSYGFYRHLGWRSTGTFDPSGDEVLELLENA